MSLHCGFAYAPGGLGDGVLVGLDGGVWSLDGSVGFLLLHGEGMGIRWLGIVVGIVSVMLCVHTGSFGGKIVRGGLDKFDSQFGSAWVRFSIGNRFGIPRECSGSWIHGFVI